MLKEEEKEKKKKNSNKKSNVKAKQSKKFQEKKKKLISDSENIKKETIKSVNLDKANNNNHDSNEMKSTKNIGYVKVSHLQKNTEDKYENYGTSKK